MMKMKIFPLKLFGYNNNFNFFSSMTFYKEDNTEVEAELMLNFGKFKYVYDKELGNLKKSLYYLHLLYVTNICQTIHSEKSSGVFQWNKPFKLAFKRLNRGL